MPSQRAPLNPFDYQLSEFAQDLGELRKSARLSFRAIANTSYYSHVVFVRATKGKKLPTWPVVECLVKACGAEADMDYWEQRWKEVRAAYKVCRPSVRAARSSAR